MVEANAFDGYPRDVVTFLSGLEVENSRTYFGELKLDMTARLSLRTTGETGRRPVSGPLKRAPLDDESSVRLPRHTLATMCARRRGEDVENRRPAPTL